MSEIDWNLLSSYAGLISLATVSIYSGAYGSLTTPRLKAADGSTVHGTDEEEEDIPERLSSGDASLFPIIGSALLFGMYVVVKYFGKEWINWLLQWYFTIAGVGSVSKTLIAFSKLVLGAARWKQFDNNMLLIRKGSREIISFSVRTPSILLIILGSIPSVLYTFGYGVTRRSALLTDILALSFSYNALSLLKIDSFKTGFILLSGLFLYDIWWVFGTEVMVKVATTLDVPIKLLWPKSMLFSAERGFTMLGLGDVVVPGMFIALALRYDQHRATPTPANNSYSKPYFCAAVFAYVAGLATTMSVMHFFQKAQPALLYLSPACMLSFLITAVIRGELKEAWLWSDEPEGTQDGATKRGGSAADVKKASDAPETDPDSYESDAVALGQADSKEAS